MTAQPETTAGRDVAKAVAAMPSGTQVPGDILDHLDALDVDTTMRILTGDLVVAAPEDGAISNAIMRRILETGDVDAILDPLGASTAMNDLKDQLLEIRDFILLPSQLEGKPVYMLLDAVRMPDGEVIVANTSAANIMAQLWRLKQLGHLPLVCKVVEAAAATPGRSAPIRLARPA